MTDTLDTLSDSELSERVATECAGFTYPMFPPFATSADAVLPLLEKYRYEVRHYAGAEGTHRTFVIVRPDLMDNFTGDAVQFPRAACFALLRAKLASQHL